MLFGLVAYLSHKWGQINRRLKDAEEVLSRDKRMEMFYQSKRENTENNRTMAFLWPALIAFAVLLAWHWIDPVKKPEQPPPKVETPKDTIPPIIES